MSDLDIARDDLALDALAAGLGAGGDDEALALLAAFRADLEPAPAAVVPLRPRRRRAGTLVGLSAAAGLVLGGLTAGAVVTADQPGQLLYAAHKAVLGDPKAADRVARLLDDAAEEIAEGDLEGARDRLDKAAERLAGVEDPAERAALEARLARLRALAAAPAAPAATPSRDDDPSETPEPRETDSPDDSDSSGSGSDGSGSDDSSGSGSSGSGSDSDAEVDNSGSGSSGSGSGSDSSGKGSDDVLKTLEPDDDRGGDGKD